MEDLDWNLQLKESEVAHAYKEVQVCCKKGCDREVAKSKLERLLEEEAALAYIVLEQAMPTEQKTDATRLRVEELLRKVRT